MKLKITTSKNYCDVAIFLLNYLFSIFINQFRFLLEGFWHFQ